MLEANSSPVMIVPVDVQLKELFLPSDSQLLQSIWVIALVPPLDRLACSIAQTLSHARARRVLQLSRALTQLVPRALRLLLE